MQDKATTTFLIVVTTVAVISVATAGFGLAEWIGLPGESVMWLILATVLVVGVELIASQGRQERLLSEILARLEPPEG